MLIGFGAAVLTKDKAEEALGGLVGKGKISASDAKETARKISDDGKQEFESCLGDSALFRSDFGSEQAGDTFPRG